MADVTTAQGNALGAYAHRVTMGAIHDQLRDWVKLFIIEVSREAIEREWCDEYNGWRERINAGAGVELLPELPEAENRVTVSFEFMAPGDWTDHGLAVALRDTVRIHAGSSYQRSVLNSLDERGGITIEVDEA